MDHYFEWLKLMTHLGPYVSMGFRDMQRRAMHMVRNRKLLHRKLKLLDENSTEYIYLMDFINLEYELGVQAMNKNNVSEQFDMAVRRNGGRRVKEWMREDFNGYQATARTFVRAGWFYDFVEALFALYVADRKLELSEIARRAYTDRLAFRHVWILRHPARWAMSLVSSR